MTLDSEVRRRAVLGAPVLGECVYCDAPAQTWDHVIPRGRPGADDPDNLMPACWDCNRAKGARTPEEWFSTGTVVESIEQPDHSPLQTTSPARWSGDVAIEPTTTTSQARPGGVTKNVSAAPTPRRPMQRSRHERDTGEFGPGDRHNPMKEEVPMEPVNESMAYSIDMDKVLKLALEGATKLKDTEPRVALHLLESIAEAGGAAVTVARWPDGGAAIAVGVKEVWSGRLVDLLRDPPERLN
jgi:hypothetical protein